MWQRKKKLWVEIDWKWNWYQMGKATHTKKKSVNEVFCFIWKGIMKNITHPNGLFLIKTVNDSWYYI